MDIRFQFPMGQLPLWLGLATLAVLALAWVLVRLDRVREGRLHRFVEAQLAPRLLVGYDARIRRPLFWLTILGFALVALAIMQPRWGKTWVNVERSSRDILVLLDTSESMNAQNPAPNRLTRARQKIETLMERCPGDRFGLIAYSGDAQLQCPLTLDHGYFRSVLNAVDTDTMTEEGTDIQEAIATAEALFAEESDSGGSARRYSRAIIVLSDGEQVTGDAVAQAAKTSDAATIHVVGIGDPEGALVTFPEWMLRHASIPNARDPHLSKLDEDTLSKIAIEGGGVYVRSTPGNEDVDTLYNELDALEARATQSDLRFNMVNRYRWPLAAATACFLAEGLWLVLMPFIRDWRMRRAAAKGAMKHA